MKRSLPDEATGSQTCARSKVRMKQENDGDSNATHPHTVKVRFSAREQKEIQMTCKEPCTVLELLKSSRKYNLQWSDENIVIQVGTEDKERIIATHFPCTCINDGELLTLYVEKLKVEEAKGQREEPIGSRDRYSVFYIETVGGKNTKQKKLFKNNAAIKEFKFVVVYGEKGTTVEEAVKRDGRFIDDLGDFTLSHNEKSGCYTEGTDSVDKLNDKKFKLCLPLKRGAYKKLQEKRGESNTSKPKAKTPQRNPGASHTPKQKCNTMPPPAVVHQRGIGVRTAMTKPDGTVDLEEIYEILCKQCQGLKEWMESRFPDGSYQKALNLRKEDFGKIQQSFSEVHRVRDILKLGKSVCKVIVEGITGTGFVLFDNYILTNAHLFEGCTEGQTLKQGVKVYVLFNYEKPEPFTNYNVFEVADSYIHYIEDDLDYAVLMLNTVGEKFSQSKETMEIKVPPGLLNKFGPKPPNGGACIIGHPGGHLKQMDLTCIIEKEKREQAVAEHFPSYRDTLFTIQSIHHSIKKEGIEQIMTGGNIAEKVVTYNTFMYHGSSGSPVFDAHGRVFGLHTSGFVRGFPKEGHLIEFAQPLLTIFEHFVKVLKERNLLDLLRRVEKEAIWNIYLRKVLSRLE